MRSFLFLLCCFSLLSLLWLPGVRYPVVSDAEIYGLLGRSLWQEGAFALDGQPYAKQLPLHALLSYPLVHVLGLHAGMHLSSLLSGFCVLLVTFLLVQMSVSPGIAAATTLAVLSHPGFVLMSMLGSADLLFTSLFLGSLLAYLHASRDQRWYLLSGALAGLACLTRYNGIALFPLFFGYTAWARRTDLRSRWFWSGMLAGAAIFGSWLLRNFLVLGNPLSTEYTTELASESKGRVLQILSNAAYYANPVHNVFPALFPFACIGLATQWRRHHFLLLAMLSAWGLTAVWWVQAIRFAFPGYPLLLMFAVLGVREVLRRIPRWFRHQFILPVAVALSSFQALSLCLYTYGACNAAFDRSIGLLPSNMGLSSEGFYAWDLARQYVNAHAERGASIKNDSRDPAFWGRGVFRLDLQLSVDPSSCPSYAITQRPRPEDHIVFQTKAAPVTSVVLQSCE